MTLKFAKLDKFVNKIRKFNELEKKWKKNTQRQKYTNSVHKTCLTKKLKL